jgi:chondroitin AC lyase
MAFFLIFLVNILSNAIAFGGPPDLATDTIAARIEQEILDSIPSDQRADWEVKDISEWRKSALPDGSFSDLDYIDQQRVDWGPLTTINRALVSAMAYRLKGNPYYLDPQIEALAIRSIRFISSLQWWHYNWWTLEIGLPLSTYKLLFLMSKELDPTSRNYLLELTRMGNIVTHPSQWPVTGQNAIWYAEVSLALGVLDNDPSLIRSATKAIEQQLSPGNSDGIQEDLSFFQHGRLFYNGGYGLSFSQSVPKLVQWVQGTPYAIGEKNYEFLANYILDGQLWLVQGKTFDYSSLGRVYARIGGANSDGLLPACEVMALTPGNRQAEFQSCASVLNEGTGRGRFGNRFFWKSDFMTHNRPPFGISVRMVSKRTQNADTTPNGEGLRSEFLADGMTYIHREGNEYFDIHPVFNFMRIPGATTEALPVYPPVPNGNYQPHRGETKWVGGVSDGETGTATMDFKRGRLRAKKTWFFFGNGMIALGAGIQSSGKYPVITTLNQEWSVGKIEYALATKLSEVRELPEGENPPESLGWAFANGVGYIFLSANRTSLKNEIQTGSWRLLGAQLPPDPVSGKVTSLWMNHAKDLDSYAYAVLPNVSRDRVIAEAKTPTFSVLENDENVQAVEFFADRVVQASFFKGGSIAWKKSVLSASGPILLQLKQNLSGCTITASNPDRASRSVTVKWQWCSAGTECSAPGTTHSLNIRFRSDPNASSNPVKTFSVPCR